MHALEEAVIEVQKNSGTVGGKDLLPAVTQLKLLFTELQNMRGLVSKFSNEYAESGGGSSASDVLESVSQHLMVAQTSHSELEAPLHNIVQTLCERTDKRASLLTYGFDDEELPVELADVMVSSSVQFIRNSIVHGGLLPEARLAQRKTDFLNIVVSVTKSDEGFTLIVRDDGQGLDEEAILARAIKLGLVNAEAAKKLEEGQALRYIFKSGFSTKEEADMDAGRGVGLNSVYSMITKAGGVISMRHKQGSFCQFQAFFAHKEEA